MHVSRFSSEVQIINSTFLSIRRLKMKNLYPSMQMSIYCRSPLSTSLKIPVNFHPIKNASSLLCDRLGRTPTYRRDMVYSGDLSWRNSVFSQLLIHAFQGRRNQYQQKYADTDHGHDLIIIHGIPHKRLDLDPLSN